MCVVARLGHDGAIIGRKESEKASRRFAFLGKVQLKVKGAATAEDKEQLKDKLLNMSVQIQTSDKRTVLPRKACEIHPNSGGLARSQAVMCAFLERVQCKHGEHYKME